MKDIPGYEGLYAITKDGKVWSHISKGFLLQYTDKKGGYCSVSLCNDKKITKRIHQLMGITFLENKYNKETVNHINGVRNDNRLENLEWNTHGENIKHGWVSNGRKQTEKQKAQTKVYKV